MHTYRQFWTDIKDASDTLKAAQTRLDKALAYYDREVKDPAAVSASIRDGVVEQQAALKTAYEEFQTLYRVVNARWSELAAIQTY